jgi:uncharacterized phage protein (TIGR01671 family)
MSQIKFRGKSCGIDGKWVIGSLIITKTMTLIAVKEMMCDTGTIEDLLYGIIEVDPKTVGQFTGLKDKTGKDIYKNDLVVVPQHYDENYLTKEQVCKVSFEDGQFYYRPLKQPNDISTGSFYEEITHSGVEIIGNIHENKELLGEKVD